MRRPVITAQELIDVWAIRVQRVASLRGPGLPVEDAMPLHALMNLPV